MQSLSPSLPSIRFGSATPPEKSGITLPGQPVLVTAKAGQETYNTEQRALDNLHRELLTHILSVRWLKETGEKPDGTSIAARVEETTRLVEGLKATLPYLLANKMKLPAAENQDVLSEQELKAAHDTQRALNRLHRAILDPLTDEALWKTVPEPLPLKIRLATAIRDLHAMAARLGVKLDYTGDPPTESGLNLTA